MHWSWPHPISDPHRFNFNLPRFTSAIQKGPYAHHDLLIPPPQRPSTPGTNQILPSVMLTSTFSKSNLARGALLLVLGALPTAVHSLTNYANDFVDPGYIVGKKFPSNTVIAQKTIVQWADQYASLGPWSMCVSPLLILTRGGFPEDGQSALTPEPPRCHEQEYCPTYGKQAHVHELVAILVARLFERGKYYRATREGRFAHAIHPFRFADSNKVVHSLHQVQVCTARRSV